MRTDVNPKDPTHSKDTAVQAGGTKNRLNVETHLKHISELLLNGFGGELSKPTLTGITDLARKARECIDQLFVFPTLKKATQKFRRNNLFEINNLVLSVRGIHDVKNCRAE